MSTQMAQPFTVRLVVGWLAALALACMSPGPTTAQGVTKIDSCPFDILLPGHYLVTQDLVCPFYGIRITVSDVNLNVGGHTIDGLGLGHVGIDVRDATNVLIRNGTITRYNVAGLLLSNASGGRVQAMTLTANFFGFLAGDSDDNTITSSTIEGNDTGVELVESNGYVFHGNKVRNNEVGYWLSRSSNNLITASNITGNRLVGVVIETDSNNNTVQSSQVLGNLVHGILLAGSTNNTVKSNTVKENRRGIVVAVFATANLIESNTARENTVIDLEDENPNCDTNVWRHNNFDTANQPCIE